MIHSSIHNKAGLSNKFSPKGTLRWFAAGTYAVQVMSICCLRIVALH